MVHVRVVLQRLLENRLFVKAEKCLFHSEEVSFLGSCLGPGKIMADPEKVRVVVDWPRPTTHRKLQQFLGFANFYRRFIRNYSTLAAPITQLTSSARSFSWSPAAESAFTSLKKHFSAPILIQSDPSKQFMVEVDASDSGVGAVLSQRSDKDSKLHPCAFFSRKLCLAERN